MQIAHVWVIHVRANVYVNNPASNGDSGVRAVGWWSEQSARCRESSHARFMRPEGSSAEASAEVTHRQLSTPTWHAFRYSR